MKEKKSTNVRRKHILWSRNQFYRKIGDNVVNFTLQKIGKKYFERSSDNKEKSIWKIIFATETLSWKLPLKREIKKTAWYNWYLSLKMTKSSKLVLSYMYFYPQIGVIKHLLKLCRKSWIFSIVNTCVTCYSRTFVCKFPFPHWQNWPKMPMFKSKWNF